MLEWVPLPPSGLRAEDLAIVLHPHLPMPPPHQLLSPLPSSVAAAPSSALHAWGPPLPHDGHGGAGGGVASSVAVGGGGPGYWRAKLSDFGLARLLGAGPPAGGAGAPTSLLVSRIGTVSGRARAVSCRLLRCAWEPL